MLGSSERRAAPRVALATRVVIQLMRTAEVGLGSILDARAVDVSIGGLRFDSDRHLEDGDWLHCFFTLGTDIVFATAQVVYRRSAGQAYRYGCRFTDLRGEDRRRIAEYVESSRPKG
jgi:hypothetical protein